MPLFLLRYRYTQRAIRSLIDRPEEDHASEAAAMVASLGGKLLGYWFAFGEFDGVTLIDAPDNQVAAAVAMAVGGGGRASKVQTTVLMTMEEAQAAKHRAAGATHLPRDEDGHER